MPRGARLDAPGTLHHVMVRGIEKGAIFRHDDDREEFLRRLGKLAKETATDMYAYALMNNHAHILLRSGPKGLSLFMRRLLSAYARYFNKRYQRVGHLFQDRYKSIVCDEQAYFEKLVAYIHLNPLRGGLVTSLEQLAVYPWCSHHVLIGVEEQCWVDREYVLRFFGETEKSAVESYLDCLQEEMQYDHEEEFAGGGLLRSHGGWPAVLSMRKKGIKAISDERILGRDEFVRQVLKDAESCEKRILSDEERMNQVQNDIELACQEAGITAAFLKSGGRYAPLPKIRKALAVRFVVDYGLSLAETARQLGVTTNAVAYMVRGRGS
ncbi:MAG: transposase [Prosthecochloris sp.]|nr:transposase [Prosthecochloris sp.]